MDEKSSRFMGYLSGHSVAHLIISRIELGRKIGGIDITNEKMNTIQFVLMINSAALLN